MFELAKPSARRATGTFDRLFDEFFGAWRPAAPGGPALNWAETEDSYLFEAALPGVGREDLSIEAQGGKLSIVGQRRLRSAERETRQFTGGRLQGQFQRTVSLPDNADSQNVRAELKHGILTITIAKKAEAQPRRIEIQ